MPKERWVVSPMPIDTFSLQNTHAGYPSSSSPDTMEERQPALSPVSRMLEAAGRNSNVFRDNLGRLVIRLMGQAETLVLF